MVSCSETQNEKPLITSQTIDDKPASNNKLSFNWEDDFSKADRIIHKKWITTIYNYSEITLGHYPYNTAVYFHHSNGGDDPVSFGYASRKTKPQVHFYVKQGASLAALLKDWIAPHEISHLSVPFTGKTHKWFSEGYATFCSRQTLMEMGYYTQQEFDELYTRKIAASTAYQTNNQTFEQVADSLQKAGFYSDLYWGGASFFLTIDLELRAENRRLIDIIQAYQQQNRTTDHSLEDVIHSFDEIIGESYCADLLNAYRNAPSITVVERYL